MSTYQSVEYLAQLTKGVLADGRDANSKMKIFKFKWVVPTTPGAAPYIELCKVPRGFKPCFVNFQCEALSASAGVGLNARIGDAGDGTNVADDDRLMQDVDSDTANSSNGLALAGSGFEYLAETVIGVTVTAGKTPVAAKTIWGYIAGTLDG